MGLHYLFGITINSLIKARYLGSIFIMLLLVQLFNSSELVTVSQFLGDSYKVNKVIKKPFFVESVL